MTKTILILAIAAVFVAGSILTGTIAFADDEPRTLEGECAKKLDKKTLKLDGLFCAAIFALQDAVTDLQAKTQQLMDDIFALQAKDQQLMAKDEQLMQKDADLQSQIDVEEARALVAEAVLASDLAQEIADRIADVDAEEAARIAADNALATDIAVIGPHFSGNHADLTNVLPNQHHTRYTNTEAVAAVGSHTTNTNAATICGAGKFLNGDGTCDPVPTGISLSFTNEKSARINKDISGNFAQTLLGPDDGRVCFLTGIDFRDIDSEDEDASCDVRLRNIGSGPQLFIFAFANGDAAAFCEARCILID